LELIKIGNVTPGYVLVLAINEFHIKTPPFLHQAYLCICKSNGSPAMYLRQKSLCVYQYLGD